MSSISYIINGMSPAPAFPRFSSLPVEIRLMIWKLSLEPRIIEIDFGPDQCDIFFTTHSFPPALHVCQESGNAVIVSYPLCFGSIYYPATLRFNFSIDTLYISSGLFLATYPETLPLLFTTFKDREIAELQWLAIDAYLYGNRRGPNDHICTEIGNAVGRLAGLKEIVFAYDIDD